MAKKKSCRCTAPLRADGTCIFGCAPLGSIVSRRRKNSVGVKDRALSLPSAKEMAAAKVAPKIVTRTVSVRGAEINRKRRRAP